MSLYDTSTAMHIAIAKKITNCVHLPFVQQVVFQSLFHLEDEVPKAVHRHGSDEHSSIVPYLKNNENKSDINNNGHKHNRGTDFRLKRGKTNGNETAVPRNNDDHNKGNVLATLSTEKYVQNKKETK